MFFNYRCWAIVCSCLLLLSWGCASPSYETSSPMTQLEPPKEEELPEQDNPGSLYQPSRADQLFADNRARRTGDLVMVDILERSQASSEASTTADSESDVEMGISNFFGQNSLLGIPGSVGQDPAIRASSRRDFEGEGTTDRSTQVTATVAARVVQTQSNGLMQVQGAREIRVNGENQIVAVSGLIRPRDIAADNSINSDQLADAQIEFYGRGVLADKQRPGWLTRVLDNVWPF